MGPCLAVTRLWLVGWLVGWLVEQAESLRSLVGRGLVGRASSGLFGDEKSTGGPLPITKDVRLRLAVLHPSPRRDPDPLTTPLEALPPGTFDDLDKTLIRTLAGQLRGGSGPSGLSTDLLRQLCRCKRCGGGSSM